MRAIVVEVNGKPLCTAGVGTEGVLSSIVTWVGRAGSGGFRLSVGGLDSTTGENFDWPVIEIGVGDEITTRLIETEVVDEPTRRQVVQEPTKSNAPELHSNGASPSISDNARPLLLILNHSEGKWLEAGRRQLDYVPSIGEWVRIDLDGRRTVVKIAMVSLAAEPTDVGGTLLYGIVEGEEEESVANLLKGHLATS